MATYEQWRDAFNDFYDTIPGDSTVPCPNCGRRALRAVFTGDPERMVGYAHFWCDHCREGIGISRTLIPDGAVMRNIHDAPEDRAPAIPDYHLVPPV